MYFTLLQICILTIFCFWIQANDDPLWYRQHKGPVWTKGICAILLWRNISLLMNLTHVLFFPGWFQPHQEQPTVPVGTVVTSAVEGFWSLITMGQRFCFPFLLLYSLEVYTLILVLLTEFKMQCSILWDHRGSMFIPPFVLYISVYYF
jgi:hypothetical protein